MHDDVEKYVHTWLTCQQDKPDNQKKDNTWLTIPSGPWESVPLDFLTSLPIVGDVGTILSIVDRFSKYATYVLALKYVSVEKIARLFFKYVVKYWGMPKSIVYDWDSHFTGAFWIELFKFLGSWLDMFSSYHPETDGLTERFNSMLEEYFHHFININ